MEQWTLFEQKVGLIFTLHSGSSGSSEIWYQSCPPGGLATQNTPTQKNDNQYNIVEKNN